MLTVGLILHYWDVLDVACYTVENNVSPGDNKSNVKSVLSSLRAQTIHKNSE